MVRKKLQKKIKKTPTSLISDHNRDNHGTDNMPIYDVDEKINIAYSAITIDEKILMPVYDPISSLLINPNRQITLGEIAKKLEGNQ